MRLSVYVLFLLTLVFVGCGGGGGGGSDVAANGGNTNGAASRPTGTVVVRQTLAAREIVREIDAVRISGWSESPGEFGNGAGVEIYPARELPKAASYTLSDFPAGRAFIKLEYLQDGTVRGVFIQELLVEEGETFEILDPDYTDLAGLFSRIELFGESGPYRLPGEPVYLLKAPLDEFFVSQVPAVGFSVSGFSTSVGGQGVDISRLVALESDNTSVLRVLPPSQSNAERINNPVGYMGPFLLVGESTGTATLTARFLDLESSIVCEVAEPNAPYISDIRVLESGATIQGNTSTQLNAVATFANGTIRDITSECEWDAIAVDEQGRASIIQGAFDQSTPGLFLGQPLGFVRLRVFHRPQRRAFDGHITVVPPSSN